MDALRDEDIDLTDCPEVTAEMFARATFRRGREVVESAARRAVYLDDDVLAWFKAQGEGYQKRINAILRAYKEAHRGT